ncbi:hypothetical protein [Namhaeicola litoreus]|uniref:CarboxypepD_reg-like domain-containing protein n=1 Tax=Namhaeicola litoreus TaxID=1052145 RepID=A0ABW3Y6I3_9FLAO
MLKKLILFCFLLFIAFTSNAQEERIVLRGELINEEQSTEDIHIINLTSRRGTLSDALGHFEIEAKASDTLLISSLIFDKNEIIVTQKNISDQVITINLNIKVEILQEVFVKNKELLIVTDTPAVKVSAKTLALPNNDARILTPIERKVNYYNKGGNIDKLYGILSGDSKALKQMQSAVSDDEVLDLIQIYFSEKYFISLLGIQEDRITEFLNVCQQRNIAQLYRKEAFSELISTLEDCSKSFD